MNKCTIYFLVFIIITGPGLNAPVHAALCDPKVAPCGEGSCMPCNLKKQQSVDQKDCKDQIGCPGVTKVKIEPPYPVFPVPRPVLYSHPLSRPSCLFCPWNMNVFYWYR